MLKYPFGVYKFLIKSYDSDQNGKLTLQSLFHFLQECAWDNARMNDFGFEYLEQNNAFWVLSRLLVRIDDYPDWKDEIEIKTWPKGVDGFFAIRDFQIYKNGKIIGNATSYWLILDKNSRRPKRIEDFNFVHKNFLKEVAIDQKLGKIISKSDFTETDQRKVYQSDLDVNKHVNNATYVRWILDSFFMDHENLIHEFEINFLNELMLNDTFSVHGLKEANEFQYLLRDANKKEVCKARFK